MLASVVTKVCSKCSVNKSAHEFPLASKYKDGLHFYCIACKKEYMNWHYNKDKEKYKARAKQNRIDLKFWIDSLKDKPCMDCGVKYPPYIMDFDHRENKKFNIGNRYYAYGKEVVQKEIDKCDLVCANCHRVRTWNRLNAPMV